MPGAESIISSGRFFPNLAALVPSLRRPAFQAYLFMRVTYSKGTDCHCRTVALLLHMWDVQDSDTNPDTDNSEYLVIFLAVSRHLPQ